MVWSFFALGHGKGECKITRDVIEGTVTHELLKHDGWQMKCVLDIVQFLRLKFCDTKRHAAVNRTFCEIKDNGVQREKR